LNINISIIILTQNSISVIGRLIDSLLPQLSPTNHELVFIDSNSTDGTIEYIHKIPFSNKKILSVESGSFSHSRTRMWGADNCHGDIVVFFTDDIVPCSDNFLEELVSPVIKGIASASYGVSLINSETGDPLRAHRYNDWYLRQPALVRPLTDADWNALAPAERRKYSNFDDCASCFERHVLQKVRFPDLPYGEDIGVAKRLITGNHAIALSTGAKFYHWHNISYSYFVRRMCVDQIVIKELFGLLYIRNIASLALIVVLQTYLYFFLAFTLPEIRFRMRVHWLLYSIKYILADNIGKYIGGLYNAKVHRFNFIAKALRGVCQHYYDDILRYSIRRD
jgi:glycosyltransferase involved in cell wall biosynthesis